MSQQKRRKKAETYRNRTYRGLLVDRDLVSFQIRVQETDLHIQAAADMQEQAIASVIQCRHQLEQYNVKHPEFFSTLVPMVLDPTAPPLIRQMLQAGKQAGVGPMASVAGAIAGRVGKDLLADSDGDIIVENGGDIFINRYKKSIVAIFAGESPLNYKVGIRLSPELMPLGVCTSSGTVGHSLSMGEADSVTVLARSISLADAAATRLGNEVGRAGNIKNGIARALAQADRIDGIMGVVVICNEVMGAWGDVELVPVTGMKFGEKNG